MTEDDGRWIGEKNNDSNAKAWMVFNFNIAMSMGAGLPNDLSTPWFIGYQITIHTG